MHLRKGMFFGLILCILMLPFLPTTPAQTADNFTLTVIVPSDNQRIRSMVNLLDDYWNPLHVQVNVVGFPEVTYLQNLINPNLDWDLAVVSFSGGELLDPGLIDLYHPKYSSFATKLYPTNDTNLMEEIGISQDFLNLIEDAYFAANKSRKIELLSEFQRRYNEEWLLDLPLFSKLGAVVSYRQLQGFVPEDGLASSIFRGMHWSGNANRRADQGGTEDNLRMVIQNPVGSFNPLLSNSPDYDELNSLIFPQLLLFDPQATPYPDLAIGYGIKDLENGTRLIDFKIRNNAKWMDNDGHALNPIGPKDIKFTFDMLRFPWVPTSSTNLVARLNSIRILNDTSVQFSISRPSQSDLYLIGSQRIIPEFLLNVTLTKQGSELGTIYGDKISPIESDEWTNFASLPVTGSLYYVDSKSENLITLHVNPSYWYPTIDDIITPNWAPQNNYFFDWNDNPSTTPIEKPIQPYIQEITYSIVEDKSSAALQFHFGVFDIFRSQALDSKNLYTDDPDLVNLDFVPKSYVESFLINYDNLFLRDYRVRKALLAALNREEMLQVIGTSQEIQYSPISKAYTDFYNDLGGVKYNYELARDLFREAGFFAEDASTVSYSPRSVNLPFPIYSFLMIIPFALVKRKKSTS
ncbi:MAG: hypothetical protein D6732_07315 [Methanobacteriota archaeon]|nr:MAG: hypothetical protein D6732_07315 [Euryarchaeota archaeon]